MEKEHCYICDELTGKAGRDDDSIYLTLMTNFAGYKRDDILGPLCEGCRDAFVQLGIVRIND